MRLDWRLVTAEEINLALVSFGDSLGSFVILDLHWLVLAPNLKRFTLCCHCIKFVNLTRLKTGSLASGAKPAIDIQCGYLGPHHDHVLEETQEEIKRIGCTVHHSLHQWSPSNQFSSWRIRNASQDATVMP